jgi:hypothetical protein
VSNRDDIYVTQLVARAMYHAWCKHKHLTPRPFPYSDAGAQDYASVAVGLLGYDQDSINDIEATVLALDGE